MDNVNPPLGTSPYPTPDIGYVTDLANILSDQQEQQLEDLLNKTETDTGMELLVVVLKSIKDYPGSANRSIEAFASAMFNDYGIGNMPQNNGILLLVCVKDRKARIELGAGYGHRYDAKTRAIMNNSIIPKFKNNNYPAGIITGVKACLKAFSPQSSTVQKATKLSNPMTMWLSIIFGKIFPANYGKKKPWLCLTLKRCKTMVMVRRQKVCYVIYSSIIGIVNLLLCMVTSKAKILRNN